jgi:hypothetical protein
MLRQITSRVRASSLSLRTQVRRSFTLDISSAKSRATNWEPALRLPPNPPQNNASDIEDTSNIPWVATYSAFDPDMIRPLLMSGPSWTGIRFCLREHNFGGTESKGGKIINSRRTR